MRNRQIRSRLFVQAPLSKGTIITITDRQFHYLKNVLRVKTDQSISLFNGLDGEWLCSVGEIAAKRIVATCHERTARQTRLPDVWYLPAPLKKTRFDFAVEKATELGVSRIVPVVTELTQTSRVATDRLQKIALEATEQCGGLEVPKVDQQVKLNDLLRDWPKNRTLLFCDESNHIFDAKLFEHNETESLAVLVGPEGGFSESERDVIKAQPHVRPVSLGHRILRAETAAVAALTLINLLGLKQTNQNRSRMN